MKLPTRKLRTVMKIRQPNEVPAALKNINLKTILRKRHIYFKLKQNQELKEAAKPLAKQLINAKVKTPEPQIHPRFSNDVINEYADKQVHIVEVIEKKFEEKVRQFIGKMEKGFLAHLEQEVGTTKKLKKFHVKDYLTDTEDEWLAEAQIDFTPLLDQQAVLAGQEAYKLIGYKDIYLPDKLRQTISDNIDYFAKSMIDTDRSHLVDLIQFGIENGQNINQIRDAITADFQNIKQVQAERVTRTEVMRVSNQAAEDAYQQSGLVEGKQWLGYDPCPECEVYDGDVVALDDDFSDGDPPLHPNCQCVILPVPPLVNPTAVALHVPVVTVPNVVILVLPA